MTVLEKLKAAGAVALTDAEVDAQAESLLEYHSADVQRGVVGRLLVTLLENRAMSRPGRWWTAVRCGFCHAEPGEDCKTANGYTAAKPHMPRLDDATAGEPDGQ